MYTNITYSFYLCSQMMNRAAIFNDRTVLNTIRRFNPSIYRFPISYSPINVYSPHDGYELRNKPVVPINNRSKWVTESISPTTTFGHCRCAQGTTENNCAVGFVPQCVGDGNSCVCTTPGQAGVYGCGSVVGAHCI